MSPVRSAGQLAVGGCTSVIFMQQQETQLQQWREDHLLLQHHYHQ
jgi:hypothetical protein